MPESDWVTLLVAQQVAEFGGRFFQACRGQTALQVFLVIARHVHVQPVEVERDGNASARQQEADDHGRGQQIEGQSSGEHGTASAYSFEGRVHYSRCQSDKVPLTLSPCPFKPLVAPSQPPRRRAGRG